MKKYHHLSNKIGTSCCVLTCPRSTKHADLSPYVRQAVAYSGQVPATPWLMVADERERYVDQSNHIVGNTSRQYLAWAPGSQPPHTIHQHAGSHRQLIHNANLIQIITTVVYLTHASRCLDRASERSYLILNWVDTHEFHYYYFMENDSRKIIFHTTWTLM